MEPAEPMVCGRLEQYMRAGMLRRHGQQNPVFVSPSSLDGKLALATVGKPSKPIWLPPEPSAPSRLH